MLTFALEFVACVSLYFTIRANFELSKQVMYSYCLPGRLSSVHYEYAAHHYGVKKQSAKNINMMGKFERMRSRLFCIYYFILNFVSVQKSFCICIKT